MGTVARSETRLINKVEEGASGASEEFSVVGILEGRCSESAVVGDSGRLAEALMLFVQVCFHAPTCATATMPKPKAVPMGESQLTLTHFMRPISRRPNARGLRAISSSSMSTPKLGSSSTAPIDLSSPSPPSSLVKFEEESVSPVPRKRRGPRRSAPVLVPDRDDIVEQPRRKRRKTSVPTNAASNMESECTWAIY